MSDFVITSPDVRPIPLIRGLPPVLPPSWQVVFVRVRCLVTQSPICILCHLMQIVTARWVGESAGTGTSNAAGSCECASRQPACYDAFVYAVAGNATAHAVAGNASAIAVADAEILPGAGVRL